MFRSNDKVKLKQTVTAADLARQSIHRDLIEELLAGNFFSVHASDAIYTVINSGLYGLWNIQTDMLEPVDSKTKKKAVPTNTELTLEEAQSLSDSTSVAYEQWWQAIYRNRINEWYNFVNSYSSFEFEENVTLQSLLKKHFLGSSEAHISSYSHVKSHIINYIKHKEEIEALINFIKEYKEIRTKIGPYLKKSLCLELQERGKIYSTRLSKMLFQESDNDLLVKYNSILEKYSQSISALQEAYQKKEKKVTLQVILGQLITLEPQFKQVEEKVKVLYEQDQKLLKLKKYQEQIKARLLTINPIKENQIVYQQVLETLDETIYVDDIPTLYKYIKRLLYNNTKIKKEQVKVKKEEKKASATGLYNQFIRADTLRYDSSAFEWSISIPNLNPTILDYSNTPDQQGEQERDRIEREIREEEQELDAALANLNQSQDLPL